MDAASLSTVPIHRPSTVRPVEKRSSRSIAHGEWASFATRSVRGSHWFLGPERLTLALTGGPSGGALACVRKRRDAEDRRGQRGVGGGLGLLRAGGFFPDQTPPR